MLRRLVILLLLVLAATAANAAVDPSLFGDLHWRLIGPFRGGRVLAVTGVPGEAEHFYFGSVNGGVWETRDAGRTWNPIFDSQPIGSIGAIAVAPSNPKVIYVGSGEADMRSDIAQGDGMYKSTDGGKTWSHIGLTDSQQIARVIVHPANPDLVYVAALGHPYGPNAERGVFRSSDGGKTWEKVLGRGSAVKSWDSDTGAIDLAFDPSNPAVIYAALWQTRRTPWSVYPPSNGAGSGLFKSTDGGNTWTELRGHGLPAEPGRIGIAVAQTKPQRVYAIIDAQDGGMYRSDDGGANWILASSDQRIWSRGWYFGGIAVEPDNADVVYSVNINLYRSTDAGQTFVPVKGAPGGDDYHQLWIDPQYPERRILGVDQGTVVSINGGKTWSSWYNQPTGQFYHVITDDRFPYWVYGAQQDSGAAGIPSRTNTIDGITLMNFREITAGGESDNVAPDPKDPEVIYGGRVERLDTRTQQTRDVDPTLAYPNLDRRTWTLPLVFSRKDPRVLYFANQRLFRTSDGGAHWSVISPDLTREDPGTPPNLDPATAALKPNAGTRQGVIYAIAPSRIADGDIWVGTDDGMIWRTRDEGAHWTNLTPPALSSWSKIGTIDVSRFDAEVAYVAVDRHRLEDFRPYVYRTRDGGQHWQALSNGIPDGSFVNVVREDAVVKGLLYAGTEKGVYVSFDDGDRWQALQLNLPVTSVRDIDVHGKDVVIATHGRAFWVLDDVTPLRQTAAASSAEGAYLFAPANAVRERVAGFTGTPMPKDEALAPNPPPGATIDYVLKSAPAAAITLEILDGQNRLVRRYSSADALPQTSAARLRMAPEWSTLPIGLATTPGMHRFVWPIRYAARPELSGLRGVWADGVWAPPGAYRVALTVNGRRLEQPLTVEPDPRLKLSAADYAEQFAFANQTAAAWAPLHAAEVEADALITKLGARRTTSSGELAAAIGQVLAHASALTDINWSTNPANSWWIAPQRTTSLRFLDAAFEKLLSAVDGADTAPSADAQASYEKLQPVAEAAVREWARFKAKELAPLNDRLKAAGQEAVTAP